MLRLNYNFITGMKEYKSGKNYERNPSKMQISFFQMCVWTTLKNVHLW